MSAGGARRALEAAAAATRRDARQLLAHARSVDEVEATADAVLAALGDSHAGTTDPVDVPRSILARRILARLRAGLVRELEAAGPPAPDDLFDVVAAFERVRAALEPDYAQRFADSLAGRTGLDLVVELAHDLRSPLTSILFLAEALLRERSGPVTPVQRHQLGLIYSAALGLSSVASDVLELVRSETRQAERDAAPFSLHETLEAVRDIVLPMADSKRLEIRLEIDPALGLRVGQAQHIHRVLLNLMTNALKFTNEGTVALQCRPAAGDRVAFVVRDTGRGIPPDVLPSIFEPFRRRHADGDYAFSGSGLGLTICRRLVEGMGSTLQLETAAGSGTRFWFELELPRAPDGLL
ncbi:MAG: HAMP domain-containing sensor histidine kinase [Gemmatimonadales bacterium]|nr:HAMP domain-containing sensor histidine kinase [Gemmatimonadales bacterium]